MQNKHGPDVRGLEAEAYQQGGYFTASQARAHRLSRQLVDHHVGMSLPWTKRSNASVESQKSITPQPPSIGPAE